MESIPLSMADHPRPRRPSPLAFTSLLGTGSQEVDNVQVMADVSQDLEFSHQSFVLTGCGPLCVRSKEESGPWDNGAASALEAAFLSSLFVIAHPGVASLTSQHSAKGQVTRLFSFLLPSRADIPCSEVRPAVAVGLATAHFLLVGLPVPNNVLTQRRAPHDFPEPLRQGVHPHLPYSHPPF